MPGGLKLAGCGLEPVGVAWLTRALGLWILFARTEALLEGEVEPVRGDIDLLRAVGQTASSDRRLAVAATLGTASLVISGGGALLLDACCSTTELEGVVGIGLSVGGSDAIVVVDSSGVVGVGVVEPEVSVGDGDAVLSSEADADVESVVSGVDEASAAAALRSGE